ncbi:MAG: ABC-type branched-chain amino acid transport system, ATPase component, branched-chain amino acid transport system ATP-binding protein [Candidatus Peregrinibacteria bacterium GW2011_GWF2_38_29]|nr:MAG: ABC-type branched-chain amino acid transport system, ATPase component, branched-chain amino acid transport system ATP-binding protein [Candidatus Peregrinibacteria bacterium GW2011_GWF2_38_29]HBB02562.1 ABC transporter ATP-binding protein [Candidatus Peregrinibacteria bacterium]
MKNDKNIIEVKNLVKHFGGVYAVNDLSLKIPRGEVVSIIGPNGSGKSTLVNLLSGMVEINSGVVILNDAEKLKKIKSYEIQDLSITRTFQEVRLFEQMTVIDNLLVVLTNRSVFGSFFEVHKKYHLEEVERMLQRVGLEAKKNQLAKNLSYGQRKLLEIARALLMKTEIYLFDEPFAGLFHAMIKTVSGIIKDLRKEGKTVILIEHNMDLIRELSDYVFVMDEGSLLAEGEPDSVLKKKSVIEAYLGK